MTATRTVPLVLLLAALCFAALPTPAADSGPLHAGKEDSRMTEPLVRTANLLVASTEAGENNPTSIQAARSD
jgi:hypothetical protein